MLYDVKLAIRYSYLTPSVHARSLLRVMPSTIDGRQRVLSRLLRADPAPAEKREAADFFGTVTTSLVWTAPVEEFSVTLAARVDRIAPAPQLDFSTQLADLPREIAAAHDIGPGSPHHFTASSRRAPVSPVLAEFARDQLKAGMSAFDAVVAVGRALHREMRFDADATTVDTPAESAFAARRGVCQDFSHILIGGLRGIGIPAGYVSGFLRTNPPPGKPRLDGADAMHAWVRAWVGAEMGWVEFDPTNDCLTGVDHITVGNGRDYDDVAPVCGALRGFGAQDSKQSVDVLPVRE